MIKNYKLWRGLFAVFCVLFVTVIFLTSLAFLRHGDINTFLGIEAPRQAVITEDTNYYPSDYPVVVQSGETEAEAQARVRAELAEDAKAYNITAQEEGTVLLTNKDNALPLAVGSRITLFGNATAMPVYRSNGGGSYTVYPEDTYIAAMETAFGSDNVNNLMGNTTTISTTTPYKVNEQPVEFYTAEKQATYVDDYNDAAIVMFSRFGGEQNDLDPNADGGPQLALHQDEKDVLRLIRDSGKFDKTIVLINSGWAMELDELEEYDVDACLVIGLPGGYGMHGVANVLTGKADPSGSLNNAWVSDSLSPPAMRNFGDFTFTNTTTQYKNKYVVYTENIYVGYKYYETRYQDQVLGVNNATSSKGSYASGNGQAWDYADEMSYPFGYGNSYARFTQELENVVWDRETHKVTATVSVTNNGVPDGSLYDGKSSDAVQLYVQLPWERGQAEKSAIQLVDFEKTKPLAAGENTTVTLEFDDYIFATYDQNATNGADTTKKGCYVFDEGTYYFAIGDDSHDALNNVLAARGETGMFSHDGDPVSGDADKVISEELTELDNTTHARSMWGNKEIVSNRYTGDGATDDEYIDINEFIPGKVTYLTRGDWNTYPDPVTDLEATPLILEQMEGKWYSKPENAPSMDTYNSGVANEMNFVTMRNVEWDDDTNWNAFLDQLTPKELATIPGETMSNAAIQSVQFPTTSNGDGPSGMAGGVHHIAQTVLACTFNKELLQKRGYFIAEDMHIGFNGTIYAPGSNLLRTQYGGRNGEYWSEDSVLAFICNAEMVRVMTDKGAIASVKHFAGNDQETNRHGHALFATEQAWRQGSLKAFEGAFTYGGAMGTMTSFARVGCIASTSSRATMTGVLREEWGFMGVNMTDSSKDSASYVYTAESLVAGTNQFNNDPGRTNEILQDIIGRDNDGYLYGKLRETAKYFFYTYSRSHIANGMDADSVIVPFVAWWQPVLIVLCVLLGLLAAAALVLFILGGYVLKRKGTEALS